MNEQRKFQSRRYDDFKLEEWAATKPPAPCGNQKEHYFWTEIECWPCPICAKIKEQKQKEEDENRMAEKIAAAVVKKLQMNEVE